MNNIEAYIAFMYDEKNILNCSECPENKGMTQGLPCGQQRCWVIAHLDSSSDVDDEDE